MLVYVVKYQDVILPDRMPVFCLPCRRSCIRMVFLQDKKVKFIKIKKTQLDFLKYIFKMQTVKKDLEAIVHKWLIFQLIVF